MIGIVKKHEAALPEPSLKVYVTVVVPRLNGSLGLWELDTNVTVPELSVAVAGDQVTRVEVAGRNIVSVIALGHVTTGRVLSPAA